MDDHPLTRPPSYDASFKNAMLALYAEANATLVKGDVAATLDLLKRINILGIGLRSDLPDDLRAASHRVMRTAVELKGKGLWQSALAIMRALAESNPNDTQLSLEIVILIAAHENSPRSALAFIDSLPHPSRDEAFILLFEAKCHCEIGDFGQCFAILDRLPARRGWWPFDYVIDSLRNDLMSHLSEFNEVAQRHFIRPGWTMSEADKINPWLPGAILRPDMSNANEFQQELGKLAWGAHLGPHAATTLLDFLLRHLEDLSDDKKAVVFHLIVSLNRDDAAKSFLDRSELLTSLSRHPNFIKSFDVYAQRKPEWSSAFENCLQRFLVSSEVRAFLSGDSDAFAFTTIGDAKVAALEICSRHRMRIRDLEATSDVPLVRPSAPWHAARYLGTEHVFIGIFGQMRMPDDAFVRLLHQLNNDFAAWRKAGKCISFGVATWDQTGQKLVVPGSPAREITHRLPPQLANYCRQQNFANFSHFLEHFPATGAKISELSGLNATVDFGFLRDLMLSAGIPNNEIFISVDTEEDFQNDVGGIFAKAFPDASPGFTNQARMWHRLAALKGLARAAEARAGRSVGQMALMRPDVVFISGSLSAMAEEASAAPLDSFVYCDFDEHAHFIDGIGDRYFAGHAHAVARAFDGLDMMQQILVDPALSSYYLSRLLWHRFPRTVFYEHPCNIRSTYRMGYEFVRQKFKFEAIIEALAVDAKSSPVSEARRLAALMTEGEV